MAGKALVTGGAGFIGSRPSELLLDEGWGPSPSTTSLRGSSANVSHLSGRRDFHHTVASVVSPSVVSGPVHECDVVFHLAAAVGVRLIVERPGHTLLINVQGTENVLEYTGRLEAERADRRPTVSL